MLLSLLLANIRILSCFLIFFLLWFFNYSVLKEKIKVKLAHVIPSGAPTMLVKEMINTPPLVALKKIKILSM